MARCSNTYRIDRPLGTSRFVDCMDGFVFNEIVLGRGSWAPNVGRDHSYVVASAMTALSSSEPISFIECIREMLSMDSIGSVESIESMESIHGIHGTCRYRVIYRIDGFQEFYESFDFAEVTWSMSMNAHCAIRLRVSFYLDNRAYRCRRYRCRHALLNIYFLDGSV